MLSHLVVQNGVTNAAEETEATYIHLIATERSSNVVSHVDAISKYNDRLSSILDNEKAKDETARALEKQLYADKLKVRSLLLYSPIRMLSSLV